MRWFHGVPCIAGAFVMAGCGPSTAPDTRNQSTSAPTSTSAANPADADLVMHVVERVAALAPACDKAFAKMQKQLPQGTPHDVLAAATKAEEECWNATGGFEDISPSTALTHEVQEQLGEAIDQCSGAVSDRVGASRALVRAKGDIDALDQEGLDYSKSLSAGSNQCVQGMAKAGAMVGLSHQQIAAKLAGDS